MKKKRYSEYFMQGSDDYIVNRLAKIIVSRIDKIKIRLFSKPLKFAYNKLGIRPGIFTLIGLLLAIVANVLLWKSEILFAIFLIIALFFDFLDGAHAKVNKIQSKWGYVFDSFTDLTVALITFLNIGFFIQNPFLAALAMSCLFFEEFLYSILHLINIRKVPIHSYIFAYPFILFRLYEIAFYLNIVLSILGLIIGVKFLIARRPR